MGKPVIRKTRIPVETVLEELAAAHPRLTHAGIQAALACAAKTLCADAVYPATGASA